MLGRLNVKKRQKFEKDALKLIKRFKSYVYCKMSKRSVPAWVSQKTEPETKAQVLIVYLEVISRSRLEGRGSETGRERKPKPTQGCIIEQVMV